MAVLGVDWGRARTGVAVSDELDLLAHPLTLLETASMDELARRLNDAAQSRNAREAVLGLPKNMDGTEGDSAAQVRALGGKLETLGLKVSYWDERLTTWEAERFLGRDRGLTAQKRKQAKDQLAACLILQSFLDARRRPA